MEDDTDQLARRDRLMRAMAAQMTPEQRVARAQAMHEWGLQQLRSNPEAWDRFLRRNLRQRAVKAHDNT